jgi:hypothetical protein
LLRCEGDVLPCPTSCFLTIRCLLFFHTEEEDDETSGSAALKSVSSTTLVASLCERAYEDATNEQKTVWLLIWKKLLPKSSCTLRKRMGKITEDGKSKVLSKYVQVGDEAIVLLILERYLSHWQTASASSSEDSSGTEQRGQRGKPGKKKGAPDLAAKLNGTAGLDRYVQIVNIVADRRIRGVSGAWYDAAVQSLVSVSSDNASLAAGEPDEDDEIEGANLAGGLADAIPCSLAVVDLESYAC